MAETFTSITLEVYNWHTDAWVDLTPDVLKDPVPKWSNGNAGGGPLDFVAPPGQLTFSLNNSASNSHAFEGYYSPGRADAIAEWGGSVGFNIPGFTVGMTVRLSFVYDGRRIYKWQGRIAPQGIKVIPGAKDSRRVDVTCYNWMKHAQDHTIDLLQIQSNFYPFEAITKLLENMDTPPEATDLGTSTSVQFPTVFDGAGVTTTALGEFQKIALSTRVPINIIGGLTSGEILTYGFNRNTIPLNTSESGALLMETGDQILMETGGTDYILLDDTQDMTFDDSDIMPGSDFQYGKYIYNHITYVVYPRRTDTSTIVLWTLNEAKLVPAGESITIRGQYNDPSGSQSSIKGTNFVTPVSGTDFKANQAEDGTGADATASMTVTADPGGADVEYVITNTSGTDFYTGGTSAATICQFRGSGVYFDDVVRVISENTSSIERYGISPLPVDMKYRNDTSALRLDSISGGWINEYRTPFTSVERLNLWANRDTKNMNAFLFGEPGTLAYVTETMNGLSNESCRLVGYEAELQPGADGNWNVFWYPHFKM
jgi:hypothetical protein